MVNLYYIATEQNFFEAVVLNLNAQGANLYNVRGGAINV